MPYYSLATIYSCEINTHLCETLSVLYEQTPFEMLVDRLMGQSWIMAEQA